MTPLSRAQALTWLGLNLWGYLCLALLWLVGGAHQHGLGPYLEAVGRAAISPQRLALYTATIIAYSIILELLLRRLIQDQLAKRKLPTLAQLSLMAALYGSTHLIYHPAGVLYASTLGLGTALAYHKLRDWRAMAAWHIQWNLSAIAGAILWAMLTPGPARQHIVISYKTHQLEQGKLQYIPDLGFIDRNHDDGPMYQRIAAWLHTPKKGPLRIDSALFSQWGTKHPISRTYSLTAAPPTNALERWALICSIYLDFNDHHEASQQHLGLWSGLAISAYQADDLLASWYTCAKAHPTTPHPAPPLELSAARPQWRAQALDHVSQQLTLPRLLEQHIPPQDARAITRARALWVSAP